MRFLLVLSMLLAFSVARAHEGHDHGDGKKAAPAAATVAPRFEARTDVFELVGVLAGDSLFVYLDRFDSNAPVDKAEIEVESGAFKAKLEPGAPGTYRFKAGPLVAAGKHALTFSVTAGEESDLLTATFDNAAAKGMGATKSAVGATPGDAAWSWHWLAGVALLLAAAVAWQILRRRK